MRRTPFWDFNVVPSALQWENENDPAGPYGGQKNHVASPFTSVVATLTASKFSSNTSVYPVRSISPATGAGVGVGVGCASVGVTSTLDVPLIRKDAAMRRLARVFVRCVSFG